MQARSFNFDLLFYRKETENRNFIAHFFTVSLKAKTYKIIYWKIKLDIRNCGI